MKKTMGIFLALSMMTISAGAVGAQENVLSDHHLALGKQLFQMAVGQAVMDSYISTVTQQFQANEKTRPYAGVIKQWFMVIFSSDEFTDQVAAAYAEAFTEGELQQIIDFYSTDVGQKMITTLPKLMEKGGEIGKQVASAHATELQELMKKRKAELDAN